MALDQTLITKDERILIGDAILTKDQDERTLIKSTKVKRCKEQLNIIFNGGHKLYFDTI